jgi:hypothetical protein
LPRTGVAQKIPVKSARTGDGNGVRSHLCVRIEMQLRDTVLGGNLRPNGIVMIRTHDQTHGQVGEIQSVGANANVVRMRGDRSFDNGSSSPWTHVACCQHHIVGGVH